MLALEKSLPYERILDGLRSARLVGDRVLKIGTKDVSCFVVSAVYAPARPGWTGEVQMGPVTYWIDAETKIVVQQSSKTSFVIPMRSQPSAETSTTTLLRYRLNPDLPDSRFKFQPAAGALERPCTAFLGGF